MINSLIPFCKSSYISVIVLSALQLSLLFAANS